MCSSIVHISFAVLGTLTLGSSHCLSSHTEFLNALYKLVPDSRFFESRWHVPWSGKDESISLATKRIGFVVKGPTRDTAMRFPPHYLLFEDISRSKEDNPGEMIQGVLQECDGANVPAGGVIGMVSSMSISTRLVGMILMIYPAAFLRACFGAEHCFFKRMALFFSSAGKGRWRRIRTRRWCLMIFSRG